MKRSFYPCSRVFCKVFNPVAIQLKCKAKCAKSDYDLDLLQSRLKCVIDRCGGFNHVAKMAELEPHYLWHYLYGRGPSVEGLFKIASSCEVSLDYLVGRRTFAEFLRQGGVYDTLSQIYSALINFYCEKVSAEREISFLNYFKTALVSLKIYQKMKPGNWLDERIHLCASIVDENKRRREISL